MGLIDFVKNAGQKLFGDSEAEKRKAEMAQAESAAAAQAAANRRRAAALVNLVQGLGFAIDDLSVRVDNGVARVSGKTKDQATREKVVLAVGNTAGIEQVDDRLEVSRTEPEAAYYTVQSGDTLSKIAKAHYGNAMKYPVIFEANRPMLAHPDKIYPGQVLRIPPQS